MLGWCSYLVALCLAAHLSSNTVIQIMHLKVINSVFLAAKIGFWLFCLRYFHFICHEPYGHISLYSWISYIYMYNHVYTCTIMYIHVQSCNTHEHGKN